MTLGPNLFGEIAAQKFNGDVREFCPSTGALETDRMEYQIQSQDFRDKTRALQADYWTYPASLLAGRRLPARGGSLLGQRLM